MIDETRRLRGQCYCRAIVYEVADAFEYAMNCHCGECRRATGAAYKPFAGIGAEHLRIVEGEQSLMRFGDDAGHNANCSRCGSLLYSLVRDGGYVHVTLGTLVDEPAIKPSAHIFVGSKASWELICDGLPQFDGFPTTAVHG